MKRIILLLIASMVLCESRGQEAQSKKIIIGQPSPDFRLTNVEHYKKKEVSLADFRGKHLILDFWSTGCPGCIVSFKTVNPLQQKFADRVQFLMVGTDYFRRQGTSRARTAYEKYRERWNLTAASAYDEKLAGTFEIPAVPHFVWIDDKGIIKGSTSPIDITEANIQKFLKGEEIVIASVDHARPLKPFDYNKPLRMNGNGGPDSIFTYRSVLSNWDTSTTPYTQLFISSQAKGFWEGSEKNKVQVNGMTLRELVGIAFGDTVSHSPGWFSYNSEEAKFFSNSSYCKYWRFPVLELEDSSEFEVDWKSGRGVYSYNLIVPPSKATSRHLSRIMQDNLLAYFDYDIRVETRMMPCWYLKATEEGREKLKTKGLKPHYSAGPAFIRMINIPFYQLIRYVFEYNGSGPPIIDVTGITGNVDIDIAITMMDFDAVREELKKIGLILERGKKEMKVIVVRNKLH